MKNQKGFSLIELLVVAAIIGIITAIAIPNYLSARRGANEASAISALRTYHSAQMTYQNSVGTGNFAGLAGGGVNAFTELQVPNLLDDSIGSAYKSGYQFIGVSFPAVDGKPATFGGAAAPVVTSGPTQTGSRVFMVSTDGVIYWDDLDGSNGMEADLSDNMFQIIGGLPAPMN